MYPPELICCNSGKICNMSKSLLLFPPIIIMAAENDNHSMIPFEGNAEATSHTFGGARKIIKFAAFPVRFNELVREPVVSENVFS
jgi:hypothetical protein